VNLSEKVSLLGKMHVEITFVRFYKMYAKTSSLMQGAGGLLIPDIGLAGGGASDVQVGLNCLGLNQAGRL